MPSIDLSYSLLWVALSTAALWFNSGIIHLTLAGTSVVVLSSFDATEALLENRSSIYSDRPNFPMVKDLMGWNFLGIMKYGDEWRANRRLLNQEFTMGDFHAIHGTESVAAHMLLRRLLSHPSGFLSHLRQMVGEVIISAVYGIDTLPVNDPYIALVEDAMKSFSDAMVPGRFLVDSIPILKYVPEWFPGADFKRIAREGRKLAEAVRDVPFSETKRQMASGVSKPCFVVNALRGLESGEIYYDESAVRNTAVNVYLAGADTTVSALSTFFLAMLANPEAQRKAQLEIDLVVGRGNLPDFIHRKAMPYVAAVVKEILRWKNVGPVGVPHSIVDEDEYLGYRIPAGSLVVGNIWAILHDEVMYPDPHVFKPERFLLDGKLNPEVRDLQCAFGFGRRICPGKDMATSSIWITVVSVLAMFNITKEVGKDGQIIEPSYEYEGGMVLAPVPFKCTITPRSQDAINTIQNTSGDI
ncbi:cytochrome P450 [Mycena galopus ATCC 62051]|nr:cytochrome P450 [Mycena galopus ATCC 62051]